MGVGGTGARRPQGQLMSAVGRREALEASQRAQNLQAMLRHWSAWARGLRAEMEAQSAPRSPAEAQRRLEEHQELKVRAGTLGAHLSLPCSDFLLGPFSLTCLCLVPLASRPLRAFLRPLHARREPQPQGSEASLVTGRAGVEDRQHRPGPKHRAAAACSRAPTDPRPPPGPGWLRPGAEQPGRGVAGAQAPAAAGLGAPGRPPPSCPHLTPLSPGQSQAQRGCCSRGFPSAPLARSKPCPQCTHSFEPGSWSLVSPLAATDHSTCSNGTLCLLPFAFSFLDSCF